MRIRVFITAAVLAAILSGCATVIRGTTDSVGFNSTPSGAEVHTSNGLGCVTPCTLVIKKNEEFVATFAKPGYRPKEVQVTRQIVGAGVVATAGNAIVGGLVGLGVDAATGAGFEHVPNPVNAVLQPIGAKPGKPETPASPPVSEPSKKG